jgi:CheY-like chemotaxis protein
MRQKLLLADDSITVQRVIELTFSDEGLDIVTVGDGAQAIEHLRHDRADIVLADLNMPNVDGYAVAEHVKRTPELVATTRVVLLTGAFEPVDRDRAQKLGVDGILAKPFEPQVAIELVRQLLAQPPLSPPRTVTAVVAAVASPSDWAVDVSARPAAAGAESKPPVAAGYPFEPGAPATARSTPAELDDYFKRLDEALASAGLKASPAVRDMLAESKEPGNAAAEAGAERARTSTAGSGTGAREFGARDAHAGRPVGAEEERLMSGVPPRGPGKVTLVDAFSALLAAEQGDGSAEASLTAWEPANAASDESESGPGGSEHSEHSGGATFEAASESGDAVEVEVEVAESRAYSGYGSGASATDDADAAEESDGDAVEIIEETAAPVAAVAVATAATAAVTPVTAAAPVAEPAAPAVSQEQLEAVVQEQLEAVVREQLEAVVRKVLGEMTDGLVREIVTGRVLDVAERLVREEIERLKAAAEADQA